MNAFPSIPGWDGIHPALVHFPIALFLVAPVLLLVSLVSRQGWKTWARAALVLMALGTLAAWMTVASGHAAGQLVDKTPILEREIGRHEALGTATRNLFTLLTVLLAFLMALPAMLRRTLPGVLRVSLHAVFLVACVAGTLLLANTASQGGRLVHTLGVRAIVEPPGAPAAGPVSGRVTPQAAPQKVPQKVPEK